MCDEDRSRATDGIGARPWTRTAGLLLALGLAAGCAGSGHDRYRDFTAAWRAAEAAAPPGEVASPFEGHAVLERAALVRAVLVHNPTIRAARHAWRAALERHPQVTAFEDPMVGWGVAPRSFGESAIDDAHVLDVWQRLPFPGKRALRGEAALAEAEAARGDLEAVRLRLATLASLLFDDDHFLARARAITGEHIALLESFQRIALARYEAGEATQQDPLQAETELARLLQRDLGLATRASVTRQRINTLLHRPPDAPLPPSPEAPEPPSLPTADPEADELESVARSARPEVAAASARVRAREAQVRSARLDFFPDLTLVGNYNRRLPIDENRPFVGLQLDLPLQLGRRRAALEEARARLARAQSEQAAVSDQVALGAHRALEEWREARAIVALFAQRILPAARDRVAAARAGFETGRNSFLELIDAERELLGVELDRERAVADSSRSAARVLQAVGRTPGFGGAAR